MTHIRRISADIAVIASLRLAGFGLPAGPMPLKMAIVVSDGGELLDFAGVAEYTAQHMEYHRSPDGRYAAGYSVQDPTAHAAK